MNKELETFVILKHLPYKGTIDYLNSLPPTVPYKLYKKLFQDGEVGSLVGTRLLFALSSPQWAHITRPKLIETLVEYYYIHGTEYSIRLSRIGV